MPAKVLEPSRALTHKKSQFFFLLMNMYNDIEDKLCTLPLSSPLFPSLTLMLPITSPLQEQNKHTLGLSHNW